MQAETRIVLAAPKQGDVERTATVLRDYQVPYRLGSRCRHAEPYLMKRATWLATCASL